MKYVYHVTLWKGSAGSCLNSVICTDYIKAREAVQLLTEFCWDWYGVHPNCFNEIVTNGPNKYDFMNSGGYVRAWKAITNDIYTIHITKRTLNHNRCLEKLLHKL